MAPAPKIVLSIAGFDPVSGAGVTADVKTIAAHGCYGTCCITALTVQSTLGVRRVEPVSPALVRDTLRELAADLPPDAVRIGMLGSAEVAEAVADFLEQLPAGTPSVLDPILHSSSGAGLLDTGGVEVLRSRLMALATVLTPNLDEAAVLTGRQVTSIEQMRSAAAGLQQLGASNVVLKGGHLEGEAVDLLSCVDPPCCREFRGPRIESRATHGTGCAFATALACNLALGVALPEAVAAAKAYVATAVGRAHSLGSGHGPMNHLFRLEQ